MNNINNVAKTREQLSALATHLEKQRQVVLQGWRAVTEQDATLTTGASLSRIQFNDHIPGVLDGFAHTLRLWPDEVGAQAEQHAKAQETGHGLQRWQQGYQLSELTREWGYLQMYLMEAFENYAAEHPTLEPDVMPIARRALTRLFCDGIGESTDQYWRLHQAEAAGHVHDLEKGLDTLNELEQARAATWREAAHDLRGSVGVVKGATSMLDREDVPEPLRLEFFDILQKGVSSLHEMLNDLMSLARLEAGQEQRHVAPFDAAMLLTDFCTTSLPMAQARGLFLKMDGPTTLLVEGDRIKIQRILQNLLLNALKYTQRGGVTVIWGAEADGDPKSWMFCVQDTGPGLDRGPGTPLALQLCEATQTAREVDDMGHLATAAGGSAAPTVPAQSATLPADQQPGEGVGLSIVKRLCELLDAQIELETSAGAGSTFRVMLPRHYDI